MYIGKVPKVFFSLSPDWIEQQMLRFFWFYMLLNGEQVPFETFFLKEISRELA
jgi:hypothetical protein